MSILDGIMQQVANIGSTANIPSIQVGAPCLATVDHQLSAQKDATGATIADKIIIRTICDIHCEIE